MNNIIDNKQCTILWQVDDLKTCHVDPAVVSSVLADIDAEYGKITKMTITQGKVHKYLGMTIDYSLPGKVMFSMVDYIGKMLDDIPENMKGESATPTAHHLFDISEDSTKLPQADADLFHHFVAQLLYISNRARPDIQPAVSFLCTIVIGPDTDDYKKLARVMKYIQGTIGLPLILSIDKSGNIKWHVDALFAVHKDIRSHTGVFMTMGTEEAYVQSRKQKLNTNSSTEAEFVGVNDVLTQLIWTKYFLKEQGYIIHYNFIYQDNQSAIKLDKNGSRSIINSNRHINTRYYFISDSIIKQEASVEFFPILDMIGDYFRISISSIP